ncbi:Retrotransposon gag protein [Gossypium australe]|uniref:Retrotransposon gag protein n=1 Tax=Gossypium australe TaxID=47621 RepID=A0A5B6X0V5_9ROSI|nr:Retrotransposon gag protein [Gossypium australe]
MSVTLSKSMAKQWLNSLLWGPITTWDQIIKKFLLKYFPPTKIIKLKNDIFSFFQFDIKTLYDTWERFKNLFRRCPHHGLHLRLQVQTFYNDLNPSTKQIIDAAAGGTLNNKILEAAQEFIKSKPAKVARVVDIDVVSMLANQVNPVMKCDANGAGMINSEYSPFKSNMEHGQVNFMGNNYRPQNNPYSNNYNPGWRTHPNYLTSLKIQGVLPFLILLVV